MSLLYRLCAVRIWFCQARTSLSCLLLNGLTFNDSMEDARVVTVHPIAYLSSVMTREGIYSCRLLENMQRKYLGYDLLTCSTSTLLPMLAPLEEHYTFRIGYSWYRLRLKHINRVVCGVDGEGADSSTIFNFHIFAVPIKKASAKPHAPTTEICLCVDIMLSCQVQAFKLITSRCPNR